MYTAPNDSGGEDLMNAVHVPGKGYILVSDNTELGYDYYILSEDFEEIDGGAYVDCDYAEQAIYCAMREAGWQGMPFIIADAYEVSDRLSEYEEKRIEKARAYVRAKLNSPD